MKPWDFFRLKRIEKDQWMSLQELKLLQSKRLGRIIKYAYGNVVYYRRLFDEAGIDPAEIKSAKDISRIPITTRKELQDQQPEDLISKTVDRRQVKEITTAGSSGKPLTVFLRQKEFDINNLYWARSSRANGQKLSGRTAYFKYNAPPRFWFERLGIWKKTIIPIQDDIRTRIDKLRLLDPHIIRGNAFELISLADHILKTGIDDIRPEKVFSMGSLLNKQDRQLLVEAFGAEVFDYYAATETGLIGWECSEHMGYHLNLDSVLTEVIREGRPALPGEPGRIICTSLHCRSMPFIRYDLGDIGVLEKAKCKCGRELPLLRSIEGRADDFFVSAGGKLHSPSQLVNKLKSVSGLREFRLIQEDYGRIRALLVPHDLRDQRIKQQVESVLRSVLGPDLKVEAEIMSGIPRDPARKIRSMISKVRKDF